MEEKPVAKSAITIKDGKGLINWEPVTDDVDYEDLEIDGYRFHTRRMRIHTRNGYVLSVVFGQGTHGDNYHYMDPPLPSYSTPWQEVVSTAEIAAMYEVGGAWASEVSDHFGWGDAIHGYCDAPEIMTVLHFMQRLPAPVNPLEKAEEQRHEGRQLMAQAEAALEEWERDQSGKGKG